MKLRAKHLVIAGAVLCAGVLLLAYAQQARRQRQSASGSEDDFLARVHRLQQAVPLTQGDGSLPPIDAEQDLVPIIALETQDLDLGTVSNQTDSQHRLQVFNRGKAPLRISDIRTTCACTTGAIAPERAVIAPGGESYIEVTILPRRIPGFFSHKTLTIFSNDPTRPSVQVNVNVLVEPEFALTPENLDFGAFNKGETPQQVMTLRQLSDARILIKDISEFGLDATEKESGMFRFAYEQLPESDWTAPGKAEYRIIATPSVLLPPRPFQQRIVITTNIERIPVHWTFAKGEVIAPYTIEPAHPNRLTLLPEKLEAQPARVGGVVRVTGDQPLQITDIAPGAQWLHAAPRPEAPAATVFLDVMALPDAPQGRQETELRFTVKVGDKAYPERIAVRGFLRKD